MSDNHEEKILECIKTRQVVSSGRVGKDIEEIIDSAKISECPDFISESKHGKYGIEEFRIFASKQDRKGSKYIQEENKNTRSFEKSLSEKISSAPNAQIVLDEDYDYSSAEMNIENFRLNFKSIVSKHLKSSKTNYEQVENLIFLVTCDSLFRGKVRDGIDSYQEIFNPIHDKEIVDFMKTVSIDGWLILLQDDDTVLEQNSYPIFDLMFNRSTKDDFNLYYFSHEDILNYEISEKRYCSYSAIERESRSLSTFTTW